MYRALTSLLTLAIVLALFLTGHEARAQAPPKKKKVTLDDVYAELLEIKKDVQQNKKDNANSFKEVKDTLKDFGTRLTKVEQGWKLVQDDVTIIKTKVEKLEVDMAWCKKAIGELQKDTGDLKKSAKTVQTLLENAIVLNKKQIDDLHQKIAAMSLAEKHELKELNNKLFQFMAASAKSKDDLLIKLVEAKNYTPPPPPTSPPVTTPVVNNYYGTYGVCQSPIWYYPPGCAPIVWAAQPVCNCPCYTDYSCGCVWKNGCRCAVFVYPTCHGPKTVFVPC